MADLTKTIEIIFGGKNEASKVFTDLDQSLGSLETSVNKVADPLSKVTENILKVDAALAAMAVGGLAYAYKKSVEYESAVVGLRKVVGDSPKEMEAAKAASMSLSGAYGENATKILDSTSNFVQAGFKVRESIDLTKSAMDLKIAGDVSAAESSEYLISILKGFKAPASEAGRVVDVLNEVSNKYATNVQQLAIGMADLSPIAKTMGFNFEETAGLLTPVIEVFRSGSEAAMGLKTGLLKLIDDSAPVQKALASIGVAQKGSNGALRSGKDILLDVSKAFGKLAEPQKLFVTQQLVGIEQSARMVEVFNGLSKSLEITKVAMGAAGSAQQEVDARLASSEVVIKRLGVAFENFAQTVGDKFKDSVTKTISGGIDMENALKDIVDSKTFDPLLKQVGTVAGRIGVEIGKIAKSAPEAFKNVDFSPLLTSLDQVADGIGKLFSVNTSNPKELGKAIQTVVDSLSSLIDVSRGIGEGFVPVLTTIKEAIKAFNNLDDSTKTLTGNFLALAATFKMFGPVIGTIMFTISQDADLMSRAMGTAFGFAEFQAKNLMLGVKTLAYVISQVVLQIMELSAKIPGTAMTEKELQPMREWVSSLGEKSVDAAWNAWQSYDKMKAAILGTGKAADTSKEDIAKLVAALNKVPAKVSTVFDVTDKGTIAALNKQLEYIPAKKTVDIITTADGTTIEKAWGMVIEKFPDGSARIVNVKMATDQTSLDKAKSAIDEAAKSKELELKTKLDEAKLKEQSEVIQKSLEFKAKVDIAQIESATKAMEAMFGSINNTITSTGTLLGDMLGIYKNASSGSSVIYEQIQKESQRRDEALKTQKSLIESEIDLMKEQAKRVKSGDSLIKVSAEGLTPALDMILHEVLNRIQIRATAEGQKFLLGLT